MIRSMATLALIIPIAAGGSTSVADETNPAVTNWYLNTTGAMGTSIDETINAAVSSILADVEAVYYDSEFVYVKTSGVPSYNVGPFPGNPGIPSDLDAIYAIPLNPVEDTSGNNVQLGASTVAVFVNGVATFNFTDTFSYNDLRVWNQDANFFEYGGFDDAPGHPAPDNGGGGGDGGGGDGMGPPPDGDGMGPPPDGGGMEMGGGVEMEGAVGRYHHHQDPKSLRSLLGDDGSGHSPIIGYAFDGFPIYGPYGYSDPNDASSEIKLIDSSYNLRDITERTTLADGTVLDPEFYGPSLETYALGAYQEDYFYDPSNGDLDEHNGRWTVTPEYPDGTYAYFVTLEDDGSTSGFPHIIGSSYYGVVTGGQVDAIPEGATLFYQYSVPEPGAIALLVAMASLAGVAGRRR